MKYEYRTTFDYYARDASAQMHAPNVVVPEGNDWEMVGAACDSTSCIFWFWRRIANMTERSILQRCKDEEELAEMLNEERKKGTCP